MVSKLLGIRIESGNVIIDPVMPASFDGLEASREFIDYFVKFRYSVKEGNFNPKNILINGKDIQFTVEENIYRKGGAMIPVGEFLDMLDQQENIVNVLL